MKTRVAFLLAATSLMVAGAGLAQNTEPPAGAAVATSGDTAEKIPNISLRTTPAEIIKGLAEMAQLNLQIDPRALNGLNATGQPVQGWKDEISVRWENISARQALEDFVGRYDLNLTVDEKALVAKVGFKVAAKPAKAEDDPGASAGPGGTNAIFTNAVDSGSASSANGKTAGAAKAPVRPTVFRGGEEVLDKIPIEEQNVLEAIDTLARLARINIQFDPRIKAGVDVDGRSFSGLTNATGLRWGNMTAKEALQSLLSNHSLLLVQSPTNQVATVTVKPTREPLVSRLVQLKYAAPSNLVALITLSSTNVKILSDPRTAQMFISASEAEMGIITNLIDRLDIPPHQILISAQFWETSKNPTSLKGIDWSGTLSSQNFGFGNGILQGQTISTIPGGAGSSTLPGGRSVLSPSPISSLSVLTNALVPGSVPGVSANTLSGLSPGVAFLSADGVKATLSFMNTDADTESIATPRAVTMDGESTELSVIRNVPVFEQQQGTQTQAGVQPNTVKPNYKLEGPNSAILNEVGIKLVVTPRTMGGTNVLLDLKPEISSVEATAARSVLGGQVNEAPIFARRKVITKAMVPSGSTVVLGGLVNDEKTHSMTKVPLFGDLPLIGAAFRKDSKTRNKQNLIIFVTPTILDDSHYHPESGDDDFIKTKRAKPDEKPESPWDSGKPYDWKAGLAPINP